MIYYDRKAYERLRNTATKLLKLISVTMFVLALTGCYNAAMMRATEESRQPCQADSDCPADHMCVFNISPSSTLGECVSQNNYDPWANRQLEDFIRLKNEERENKEEEENKKQWKTLQQKK